MPLVEDQRTLVEASDEEMEVSGFLQTIYHLVRLLSWRQFTTCQDSLPPIKTVYHLANTLFSLSLQMVAQGYN